MLLRTVRRSRWYGLPDIPWLPDGEAQADALKDLRTEDNTLSLWHVEDNERNLARVLIAATAGRSDIANIDYLLFDSEVLHACSLEAKHTHGDSLDNEANNLWHLDIENLTASAVARLAALLFVKGETYRVFEKEVLDWLRGVVSSGHIDRGRLKDKLRLKVEREVSGR